MWSALIALAAVANAAIIKTPNAVANEYIVVLHPNSTTSSHMGLLNEDATVMFEYSIGDFQGYAMSHPDTYFVTKLSEHPSVRYVQENGATEPAHESNANCRSFSNTNPGLWGLSRVSGPDLQNGRDLKVHGAMGNDVTVYVLDTGVFVEHEDFQGRATTGPNFSNEQDGDLNGHGTHCTGTVGGGAFGVARNADLVDIKVMGRGGGSFAMAIAGINHVANDAGTRKIASMSFGGGQNDGTDDAVNAAAAAGVLLVAAAGNSRRSACTFSPAAAEGSFTVGSTDNRDARSGFSNFGTCMNIFAPGTNVLSSWIGSPTATRTISGTSMACPHVAGLAAEYWAQHPTDTAKDVWAALVNNGVKDIVTNPGAGSPNVLGQTTCASGPPPRSEA
mmetsp:Transcript_25216/g.27950  ORF Transcript_25216/g.27950 Transcript_25216/m.27950 type:complete len:390 (+) Transcript_25216:33-1202(+)|eukprot:CAMPEP_0205824514 /NCGR_PEP_ID=MMETSP0206-20130828/21344_1 /ASSEMBLY_ACC=CAM_ASM_000279 /TAXON_ID=36767 /ORGANISM="Euplotes focardii, Strain TN1" /LENGTH=389 /DNA_ID=CAMNT_0053122725 /DNA_START=25 /DNA_END=1194 /DNA_ORIENTATION=+